jgi:hypothetical protein
MKRQIPVFKVHVQPGANYNQLHEIPEVKEVVIEEIVYAIKDAIKRKKSKIELFEVANSEYYIELKKEQFKLSLQNAINYFLEKEEYDRCIECRDLMNSIN